jgi:hypothetical protein
LLYGIKYIEYPSSSKSPKKHQCFLVNRFSRLVVSSAFSKAVITETLHSVGLWLIIPLRSSVNVLAYDAFFVDRYTILPRRHDEHC